MKHSAKSNIEQVCTRLFQMLSNGKRCAVCGKPATEVHHIIRKAQSQILRFDPLNGLEVCHDCHINKIHAGKINEFNYISRDRAEKLHELSRINFKDFLLHNRFGITASEFYKECRARLEKTILRENDLCGLPAPGSDVPF